MAHAGQEKILHRFNTLWNGAAPASTLIADADGNLYGTAEGGGAQGRGVVFKLTKSKNGTWKESVLHSFGNSPDGFQPTSSLTFDTKGNLYGTTVYGGSSKLGACPNFCGTVFELTPQTDGTWKESILWNFQGSPDGSSPLGGVAVDSAGDVFGTTYQGGVNNLGTVFKLTESSPGHWTEVTLHSFTGGPDGEEPTGGLVRGQNGGFYGTSNGTVFELTPGTSGSWGFQVLYQVSNYIVGNLVVNPAGDLFGLTSSGGDPNCGCGFAFSLTPSSQGFSFTQLYTFKGGSDGSMPMAGLAMASDGTLFGTTNYGGDKSCSSDVCGYGTVFELIPGSSAWSEEVLYRFNSKYEGAGVFPLAGLFIDSGENLYGSTFEGCIAGAGTVFRLARGSNDRWALGVINAFGRYTDGWQPAPALVSDSSGNLYGTTPFGGTGACGEVGVPGCGMVFQMTPNGKGWKESTIYNFGMPQLTNDGASPESSLILDAQGSLYGTTSVGGNQSAACEGLYYNTGTCGTVFKLSRDSRGQWHEQVLYEFQGGSDGANPVAALTFDAQGNLYGTTSSGGGCAAYKYGCGTVFELLPDGHGGWTEKMLYVFQGTSDGFTPSSSLIFDHAGNLYGTTNGLGSNAGTVFKLSPTSQAAWTETTLYSFSGAYTFLSGLVFDDAGNLYGTSTSFPNGNVFELMPNSNGSWTEKTLYTFTGGTSDGSVPNGVVFGLSGVLYGTTQSGGSGQYGGGTIFKLVPGSSGWSEAVVYNFQCDGNIPTAPPIVSSNGTLFGTTSAGGFQAQCGKISGSQSNTIGPPPKLPIGGGTVFQFTP